MMTERAPAESKERTEAEKKTEIKGNTLRVYLHVLKNSPCELRDVQRPLGLSSASLASYHLGKLMEAGYVKQDEYGRYVAIKDTASDFLAGYLKIGSVIVPQLFFFSFLFTILVTFFSLEVIYASGSTLYLVAVSVAAVAALWYETIRIWNRFATWN